MSAKSIWKEKKNLHLKTSNSLISKTFIKSCFTVSSSENDQKMQNTNYSFKNWENNLGWNRFTKNINPVIISSQMSWLNFSWSEKKNSGLFKVLSTYPTDCACVYQSSLGCCLLVMAFAPLDVCLLFGILLLGLQFLVPAGHIWCYTCEGGTHNGWWQQSYGELTRKSEK